MTIRILLIFLVLYLVYTAIRVRFLLTNSSALFKTTEPFSRDYYVGSTNLPPLTYVILGDSTAVGVGTTNVTDSYAYAIAEQLSRTNYVHVYNFAVSGARLKDVETAQIPEQANLDANFISVTIGANDATHLTSSPSYEASLKTVITTLLDQKATVLFANTPDMSQTPALPFLGAQLANYRAKTQNSLLDEQLKDTQIKKIDLYADGKLDYSKDKSLYANDLFHPSAKGYAVWVTVFKKSP